MSKPQLVVYYNDAIKGVGISDQMSTYQKQNKTKGNGTNNGCELLTGTSVGNEWLLYNKIIPNAIPILHFKESLVESLKN